MRLFFVSDLIALRSELTWSWNRSAGFGVTYDHSGAAEAPAVDYDPQTARQETFGASPTSITSPPPSFASF
mgnify:CR=1 FL=1